MFNKSKIYFLTIVLLLFFLSESPTFAQSPRKVVCLGDSITVGYSPNFRTPDGQPCTMNARIGRPTSEMVSELRSNIIGQDFTDLIILGGTNDVVAAGSNTRTTDRAINNLQTIYTEAKAAGMRVVAVTIPPAGLWYERFQRPEEEYDRDVQKLNNFVRSAQVDAVVDAYQLLGDPANPTYLNPIYLRRNRNFPDGEGLHPNEQGSILLAQTISAQGFGGAAPSGAPVSVPEKPIITPKLSINIPTVNFSQAAQQGNILFLPFLADYISGLYKYLLAIVGVIAGIMLTIGGVQYLMAAGNKSAIDAALKRIEGALIGLIVAFGSYIILFTINPQLVKFSSLQLKSVRGYNLSDQYFADRGDTPIPQGASGGNYDSLFQKYAGCAGLDWRILKAIAQMESHFNPRAEHPGTHYLGLFQMKAPYCLASITDVVGESVALSMCTDPSNSRLSNRENIFNPEFSTFVASHFFKEPAAEINRRCPNLDTRNFVTLLYLFHNMGGGGARAVIAAGCQGDYAAAAENYTTRTNRTWSGAHRVQSARTVAGTAASYGVTQPFQSGNCPLFSLTPLPPPPAGGRIEY